MENGEVFISEDGKACAIIQFFDKKKFSWKSTYLDIQLILKTVGLSNIPKVLVRESFIKKHYPKELFTYVWFIGVEPENQGKGFGSEILEFVLDYSKKLNRPVYLETSTQRNLSWYKKKQGFKVYTAFNITHLAFHAEYGVLTFLFLPFLLFLYSLSNKRGVKNSDLRWADHPVFLCFLHDL